MRASLFFQAFPMNNVSLSQLLAFIWTFFGKIGRLAIKFMNFEKKTPSAFQKKSRKEVSIGTLALNSCLGPIGAKFGPIWAQFRPKMTRNDI